MMYIRSSPTTGISIHAYHTRGQGRIKLSGGPVPNVNGCPSFRRSRAGIVIGGVQDVFLSAPLSLRPIVKGGSREGYTLHPS